LQETAMSTKTRRLAALGLLLALAACEPRPYLPADYAAPPPAPLQPYMTQPAAVPYLAATPRRRIVRRYYRRHYHRAHCRCIPTH
jgi:hypothetical protein